MIAAFCWCAVEDVIRKAFIGRPCHVCPGRTLLLSVKPCPRPVDWTTRFQMLFMSEGSGVPNSPNRALPPSRNAFQALLSTKLQQAGYCCSFQYCFSVSSPVPWTITLLCIRLNNCRMPLQV